MRVAFPSLAGIWMPCNLRAQPVAFYFRFGGLKLSSSGLAPKEDVMFDCLADQIRNDEHVQVSNTERYVRWFAVTVLSVVVFGGLYVAIQLLQ